MLRKVTFLVGAGVGYVLGARAGRSQYEKLQEFVKKTVERRELREAVDKAAPLAEKVTTMAAQKIPGLGSGKAEEPTTAGSSSDAGSNLPPRGTFSPTYGTF